MKKFFVSILAFLYLSTSMGATIHLHYCMGKLISWSLVDHGSNHCGFCGMMKKSMDSKRLSTSENCCKDETKQIKTNTDHKSAPSELLFVKVFAADAVNAFQSLPAVQLYAFALTCPKAHAPPAMDSLPLFLRNCNVRI